MKIIEIIPASASQSADFSALLHEAMSKRIASDYRGALAILKPMIDGVDVNSQGRAGELALACHEYGLIKRLMDGLMMPCVGKPVPFSMMTI